MIGEENS